MGNCQSPQKSSPDKSNDKKEENIAGTEYSIYLDKIRKEIREALQNNIPNVLHTLVFDYLMISLIQHIHHIFCAFNMMIPFSIDKEQFRCSLTFYTDTGIIDCYIHHCQEDLYCKPMQDKFDYLPGLILNLETFHAARLQYVIWTLLLECRRGPKRRKGWDNWSTYMAKKMTEKFIQRYKTSAIGIGVI